MPLSYSAYVLPAVTLADFTDPKQETSHSPRVYVAWALRWSTSASHTIRRIPRVILTADSLLVLVASKAGGAPLGGVDARARLHCWQLEVFFMPVWVHWGQWSYSDIQLVSLSGESDPFFFDLQSEAVESRTTRWKYTRSLHRVTCLSVATVWWFSSCLTIQFMRRDAFQLQMLRVCEVLQHLAQRGVGGRVTPTTRHAAVPALSEKAQLPSGKWLC